MVRFGECNNCGWCCQFDGIHRNVVEHLDGNDMIHESDQQFYRLRGGKIIDGGKRILYVVQSYAPCSAHNQMDLKCKVYDNRPISCQEFPSTPEQIEGTPCSYWFETEINGKLIRRGGGGSPYPSPPVFSKG